MSRRVPDTEQFGKQNADRETQRRGLRDALRIDGSQFVRLYEKMQALIADLETTVTNLVNAITYTTSEIDAKIAAPGNVNSTGQLNSGGAPLKSQPSYNYMVATAYKGAWIDGATYQIGYSPSAQAVKTDLVQMGADDVDRLLSLTPYWGRYLWDDPTSPPKAFFLAADVQAAGFGPDVAPVVEAEPFVMIGTDGQPVPGVDGEPVVIPVGEAYTVNYSQIVVPLVAAMREQKIETDALKAEVAELRSLIGG